MRTLAQQAGVAFPSVYRIEARVMSPTVAMLEKLARALRITIPDLFRPPAKPRRPAKGKRARR